VTVDADHLNITGDGTEAAPFKVAHKKQSGIGGPSYKGFVLDGAGHVTGYKPDEAVTGIVSIVGTPGAVEVTNNNGAATISLPVRFDRTEVIETDIADIELDIYGRVSKLVRHEGGAAASGRYAKIFQGSRELSAYEFNSAVGGLIRGSYKGSFTETGTGTGLQPAPSAIQVTVNGNSVQAYADVVNGVIVGLEFMTPTAYQAGPQTIAIVSGTTGAAGILDVTLCLS
jgi:hypothetical protein